MTETDQNEPKAQSTIGSRLRRGRRVLVLTVVLMALAYVYWEIPIFFVLICIAAMVWTVLTESDPEEQDSKVVNQQNAVSESPYSNLERVLGALFNACILVDIQGNVRFLNAAAVDQFGKINLGDPLSFSFRSPTLLEAVNRVGKSGVAERIRWHEKTVNEMVLEAHISPISLPNDAEEESGASLNYLLISVHDLSRQSRLERMRADFVANASHELRTPLASLSGFIETLQGPARKDPKSLEKFLGIMQDQAERMARLIDDLLSLSDIELKPHVAPEAKSDLVQCVLQVGDSMKPLAREWSVELEINMESETAQVNGETDELIQVLENLIGNAIRYGADGKKVVISLIRDESDLASPCWNLSVRDFGPGIESEHLSRLTERFYRVDVQTSRELKGTGLGLAIVKHILNRHNAKLSIDSQPGQGATFTVRIPIVENSATSAA